MLLAHMHLTPFEATYADSPTALQPPASARSDSYTQTNPTPRPHDTEAAPESAAKTRRSEPLIR